MNLLKKKQSEQSLIENYLELADAIDDRTHVVLASGRHTNKKIHFDRVMQYPQHGSQVAEMLALRFDKSITHVIGIPSGGSTLGWLVAYYLHYHFGSNVQYVQIDKTMIRPPGEMQWYYERIPWKFEEQFFSKLSKDFQKNIQFYRTLVVDDIFTRGTSMYWPIRSLQSVCQQSVAGIGVAVQRIEEGIVVPKNFPRIESLVPIECESWEPGPETCPLCQKNIPLST